MVLKLVLVMLTSLNSQHLFHISATKMPYVHKMTNWNCGMKCNTFSGALGA